MAELDRLQVPYDFIWTGQHKETIHEIMDNFGIRYPDGNLYDGDEVKSLLHGIFWMLGLIVRAIFASPKRDKGIAGVHGDAVSALIGMLYARPRGYKIAVVEAGLRSFDFFRPFPEEIVRYILSFFTDYHFAPGPWAAGNLKKRKGVVIDTGFNTLYDSLKMAIGKKPQKKERYALVNLHRFENIQNKRVLNMLLDSLIAVNKKIDLLFILHPTTEFQLKKYGLMDKLNKSGMELLPRQDYITFINLVAGSQFMITDGGSNQEETSYLGHPCLLLRGETERQEGLGESVVISSLKRKTIIDFASKYENYRREPLKQEISPSKIIAEYLKRELAKATPES